MGVVTELHDAYGFEANVGVIKAEQCTLVGVQPKVVLFHSRGCGPCAERKMQLAQLAEAHGNIEFYTLKTEGNKSFWGALGIDGVPTVLCLHRDGRLTKIVGGPLSQVERAITDLA
ncbi:thioredoxin reductase [Pseudomonas sp. M47T1]|uniref:thioredoxin family protein n=1 Tax=unclassified Pseudomonas TaxID=196821 RepID=UPI0002608D98|nr:thioredoxin family protein [Pseudomonas sp. M47T1]EIK95308.1 thioredoxin reductase [Pseudomonas sp. M47T1]